MKRLITILLLSLLTTIVVSTPAEAKNVKLLEAQQAAENWIALITRMKGSWGGADSAYLMEMQELKRKGRTIGYVGNVHPKGFIVVSLRKELAPVKAYSELNNLDSQADIGLPDFIKGKMARIIKGIEKRLGAIDTVAPKALEKMLEINYRSAWDVLIGAAGEKTPESFSSEEITSLSYQEGEHLIHSSWHQKPPYNNMAPDLGCSTTTNGRAKVGCVATAGAQIMKYWNWPPYGKLLNLPYFPDPPVDDPYDWDNMKDVVTTSSPTVEQDAVAELNAEIGEAVFMNYGCTTSGAFVEDMPYYVYSGRYRYSGYATYIRRQMPLGALEPASMWFDRIKEQIDLNRPIQYNVEEWHSFVVDGWQELEAFVPPLKQYHINYGWGSECSTKDGCNTWYTLDELYYSDSGSSLYDEAMVINIYPAQSLQDSISGTYTRNTSFPYYYFDQDATGDSATFVPGLNLQFLPMVTVVNTSTNGGSFRFTSDSFVEGTTRLFTRGDTSKGIKIDLGGTLKVNEGGSIKLH